MVLDDPSKFHLITTDMKEQMIKGAIATVNAQAAIARKNAVKNVQDDFILRNKFTTSQIQYTQMPPGRYSLEAIKSSIGVTEKADYMAFQETGGLRAPKKFSQAIPQNLARGNNKGAPVERKNYLPAVKKKTVYVNFHHTRETKFKSDSASATLVAAAYIAATKRKMMRYYKGLYIVYDFIRKSDGGIMFKKDLIYNFMQKETFTPENEWLWPASEKPAKDVLDIFIAQMKKLGM
jgi:hypothetical protein